MASNVVTLNIDGSTYTTRPFGTCTTAAATAAKVVTCADFKLATGATILVQFQYANTAANPTLNVNGTGAIPIRYRGDRPTGSSTSWSAYDAREFYYDGSSWHIVGNVDTDTDTKVSQTVTTTNSSYNVMMTSAADKTTTTTDTARFASAFKYNPSTKALVGISSLPDVSSIGSGNDLAINGDLLTLQGDTSVTLSGANGGVTISSDSFIDISADSSVNISGETNIDGVITAENGDYIHMPNNINMCDLDEYKSDHYKFVSNNLSNTAAYTSTLISTVASANSSTVFKSASASAAVYSYTMTDAVNFYMGSSTTSTKDPKWIINPISNETTDLYDRTLIIPGPRVTLRYASGAAGSSSTGNTIPSVTTRLSSLTCTYRANVYKGTTLLGTKELGTTASINQVVLQTLATGTSTALAVPDLQLDFSEQEWLEWIRTKDSTFTLKNWGDNISIVIVGDINLTRPSGAWNATNVNGFEFSISNSNSSVSYPASHHNKPQPFYEGTQDGMRHYFDDVNSFSMKRGEYTELYTPEFNITTTGKGVSISGNCYATAFYETSDENLKYFGDNISVDFDKLKEIRKSYFTWKDGETGEMQIGTSAQDVQKVYPELVSKNKDGNLTVDYAKLSVVALAAVDKLEERLARIEKMLNIE